MDLFHPLRNLNFLGAFVQTLPPGDTLIRPLIFGETNLRIRHRFLQAGIWQKAYCMSRKESTLHVVSLRIRMGLKA